MFSYIYLIKHILHWDIFNVWFYAKIIFNIVWQNMKVLNIYVNMFLVMTLFIYLIFFKLIFKTNIKFSIWFINCNICLNEFWIFDTTWLTNFKHFSIFSNQNHFCWIMFWNPWLLNIWLACVEKVFWGVQGLKKYIFEYDLSCFFTLLSNLLNFWVCNYALWVGMDQDKLGWKMVWTRSIQGIQGSFIFL